jgi:hypothetical protein
LEFVAQRTHDSLNDLKQLVEVGKELHSRLDSRLTDLAPQLREQDEKLKLSNHNASYYALREQVYRCAELLKVARYRLDRQNEPRLGANPGPSAVRKRSDSRVRPDVKSRRFLRDWIDEEDMRRTISESQTEQNYDRFSTLDLTTELSDSLIMAQAMIDSALTPRRWLLGVQMLTTDSVYKRHIEFERGLSGFLTLGGLLKGPNFLRLVVDCLKHRFQYEVHPDEFEDGYFLVSGVSMIGLVGPLLGTYQTKARNLAAHLRALQAIPVPDEMPPEEFGDLIQSNRDYHFDTGLKSFPEQLWPSNMIRGSLGRDIVDYVSNSRITLTAQEMLRAELTQEKFRRWWMNCLPIPREMRIEKAGLPGAKPVEQEESPELTYDDFLDCDEVPF